MTVTIEKQNGAFTEQSKADWQAFARFLPDGCYTLAAHDCAGAIAAIEPIAAWFNTASETERSDPAYLDRLLVKSNQLAFYLLRLAQELGAMYAERSGAELQRKRGYNAALFRLRKEAGERNEKFVHAVAEVAAENEVADLKASEVLADSIWEQTRLYYGAARDILQRMSQEISNLKAHREAYMKSDNTNFPG